MEAATFRRWFRERRRALDLTQKDLARSVGCAESTVRKIEAGILRPSRQVAELLATALQFPPEEHALFASQIRFGAEQELTIAADQPTVAASGELRVAPTTLIGRERELTALSALLLRADVRLVTLTGPPGSGKTRLAEQLAHDLAAHFAATSFVDLAAVHDDDQVLPTIAHVLGVQESSGGSLLESIADHLRETPLLLVLDNFEQVITAGSDLAALIGATTQLTLLVTSREELNLRGERIFPVPPLELPDMGIALTLDELALVPAVALFVERAQDSQPAFVLSKANRSAVAAITRRVEGLPLAIELAAARTGLLPPDALLERLESGLDMLSGGKRDLADRQRTLHSAINWSYRLLDAAEQRLFQQLAVFAGAWTLEAATAICGAPDEADIIDRLDSLRRKSLLQRVQAEGEPRFRMLALIHQFAAEQLGSSGSEPEVRQAHAAYFLTLGETIARHLARHEQRSWGARMEREHADLLAALLWTWGQGQVKTALRLAAALAPFWELHGHWSVGRKWLDTILARADLLAPEDRARLLQDAGVLAATQGDYPQAARMLGESEALWRASGRASDLAAALQELGALAVLRDEYASAALLLDEALALHRAVGNSHGAAAVLIYLGCLRFDQREYAPAEEMLLEALAIFGELHNEWGTSRARYHLGRLAFSQGDYGRAERLHSENLALNLAMQYETAIILTLMALSLLALASADFVRAAEVADEAVARSRARGGRSYSAVALYCKALVALNRGAHEEATAASRASLRLLVPHGSPCDIAGTLVVFSGVAAAQGDLQRAVRLAGAAQTLIDSHNAALDPICQVVQDFVVATARAVLPPAGFSALWTAGQALSADEVCSYALEA